ncbi:MAG: hypothetical protein IT180_07160 [Acidobacteria bacterium]|nr:hypothetical protein [Acidobacteriota bacterium]
MTTPDPRDRALETLLARRPRETALSDACLDAETLAAWAEGGLDEAALAAAEFHGAGCARCQALMATIVSTAPETAVAGSLWERLGFRWLVPLTAAAAAVLLWIVVPAPAPEQPASTRTASEATSGSAIPVDRDLPPSATERSVAPPPPAAPPPSSATPAEEGATAVRQADAAANAPAPEREAPVAPDTRQQLAKQAAPPSVDALNETESREERVAAELGAPAAPAAAAPAAPPVGGAPAQGRAVGAPGTVTADRAAPRVVSGDPAVQWRLSGIGVVERSTDGGASWERLPTGVAEALTAGAAPSATVCWLVGRDGLVLVSTDGRTWQRASAPANDNLVAIDAVDTRSATVRTASGTRFRTADGGASWARLP